MSSKTAVVEWIGKPLVNGKMIAGVGIAGGGAVLIMEGGVVPVPVGRGASTIVARDNGVWDAGSGLVIGGARMDTGDKVVNSGVVMVDGGAAVVDAGNEVIDA